MSITTILKSSALGAAILVAGTFGTSAQNNTLIYNKGAIFFVNGGPSDSALVWVDGHVINQDSILINKGKFVIKGDFINNAQCGGSNTPPLLLPGNDGLFEVHGKWVNNGLYFAGSGQVKFMENDTITGTAVTQFNRLTLDFDVVRVLDNIDAEVGPNGRLELNRGELATDFNTLWVLNPNTASVTRFNPCVTCGFVSSLGNGTLARATNQAQDYLFPVGSSYIADPGTSEVRYRPVVLTPETNAPDLYHVRFANVNPAPFGLPLEQKDSTICYVNPKWYHRIHQEGGANPTAGVGIAYTLFPGTDFDANAIAKWNPVSSRWENLLNNVPASFGPYQQVQRPAWNGFLSGNGDFDNNYALAFTYPDFPEVEGSEALCARVAETYTVPQNGSTYTFAIVPDSAGVIVAQDQYSVTVEWNDVGQGTIQVIETVPNTINGGCEGDPTFYAVDIWPLPTADFTITPDSTLTPNGGGIFINDILEMADNSQLTDQWEWDFGDGNTSTQSNPFHTYDAVGSYDVRLITTTDLGCKDTLIQTLTVVEGIIVPNVFTPNGDGFNDYFDIRTSDVGPFKILIYNRWGNIVFETVSPEISWDGSTRAGVKAPSGTYYFTITKVEMNSGNAIDNELPNFNFRETGWVQLIR
jgi:gliding motility-associated-like protein